MSDISFEMCVEVKITAKQLGKNTNQTATKIMFGNSKQKSSEKLNFQDDDEDSNNIQTYKAVKPELQEEKKKEPEKVEMKPEYKPPVQEQKKPEQKSGELGQLEQLETLADLLNRGVLTKQEFDYKKKKILGI